MKTTILFIVLFAAMILAQDKDTVITINKELANIKQSKEYLKNEFKRMENIENYLLYLKEQGYEITKIDSTKVKKP